MNNWVHHMTRIKRQNGSVITNFTMSSESDSDGVEVYEGETYYAEIYKDIDKYVLHFVVASLDDLSVLLSLVPDNTVINILYKEKCDLHDFFISKGLLLYATYQRTLINYKSNPYLIPEKSKRRQLLPKLYDSNCGEYPGEEDAQEIDDLCRQVFDPLCDDMFSIGEWKEKIKKKEILVYRENGKITAFYLYRLEGQKLYSNMSVNIGAANSLYNLERRIFEEMWDRGIRAFYGWGNLANTKARNHAMQEESVHICAESISKCYCDTYYKPVKGSAKK